MPTITRLATITTTPDGTGTAWSSIDTTGGSTSANVNGTPGSGLATENDTAKWSGFASMVNSGLITSIRAKCDWSVGGTLDASVDTNGTANADYSFSLDTPGGGGVFKSGSVSVAGPGPVSDNLNINESGSIDQAVALGTDLSTVQFTSSLTASAEATGESGSTANASPNCLIDNIKIVVTLADGRIITFM